MSYVRFTIIFKLGDVPIDSVSVHVYSHFYCCWLLIWINYNDQVLNLSSYVFTSKVVSLLLNVSEVSATKNALFIYQCKVVKNASGKTLKRPSPKMT